MAQLMNLMNYAEGQNALLAHRRGVRIDKEVLEEACRTTGTTLEEVNNFLGLAKKCEGGLGRGVFTTPTGGAVGYRRHARRH